MDATIGANLGGYTKKVLGYGPIAYWPLYETSGVTAECLVNSAQDGTYARDVSVMGTGDGIGDGGTAPVFDGTNDFVNVLTAAGQAALNTATTEGSAAIWFRVGSGAWTDGTFRAKCAFVDDNSNRYTLYKSNANNTLYSLHYAGGTGETHSEAGQSSLDWMHFLLTWSESADEVKYYLDGNLLATDTTIGNWSGDGTWTNMLIGATSLAPASPWLGGLAHCAIFPSALGQTAATNLATV